jgi:hypothetical protein
LQFKSKYSSRLYLLLKSDFDRQSKHRKNLFVVYDMEELNHRFELPISYTKVYSKFKNSFLLNALEEINEKTDLQIDYKELKTGRKITSIEFCISKKQQEDKSIEQLTQDILNTETKSGFIPVNASKYAIETLLSDELELTKNDIKKIFEHYKLEDIEDICSELYHNWDNKKLISRIAFFRGSLKKLNRKKTDNLDLINECLFDEKEDLQEKYMTQLIQCDSVVSIDDYDDFCEFLVFLVADNQVTKEDAAKLKEMHKNNEFDFEEIRKQKMIEFRKNYSK